MSADPTDHASPTKAEPPAARLRRFFDLPGPKGVPLLGNALQIKPEAFHRILEGWTEQYGGLFRFSIAERNFLCVSDPALNASVLKQRPEGFIKGPRLVQVCKDLGFHGLFSANGEAWRRQRQIVLAGLDPAHLKTFLPSIEAVTARLRARWLSDARSDREIDLMTDLMRYTVDVTTCLAFGRNLNTLERGDHDVIQQHLNVIFPTLARRVLAPIDFERWLPKPGLRQHVEALQGAVQKFIREERQHIERRPELMQRPENLLQALIAACDRETAGLSDEDLSGNVLTMLLAGEDTTANTLGWLIWLLHDHPDEWKRARNEVDAIVGAGQIPRSTDQLSQLDFVEACANEAMRLKPVAPINIVQAAHDVVIGDVAVPRGVFVTCVMRPAGMDSNRFDEPKAFRPARWIDGTHAEGERMMGAKRVVMPFGGGPRVCPGRYLALAEIKMVMATLLANFDIAQMRTPEGGPAEYMSLTMSPVGLSVHLSPRAISTSS